MSVFITHGWPSSSEEAEDQYNESMIDDLYTFFNGEDFEIYEENGYAESESGKRVKILSYAEARNETLPGDYILPMIG